MDIDDSPSLLKWSTCRPRRRKFLTNISTAISLPVLAAWMRAVLPGREGVRDREREREIVWAGKQETDTEETGTKTKTETETETETDKHTQRQFKQCERPPACCVSICSVFTPGCYMSVWKSSCSYFLFPISYFPAGIITGISHITTPRSTGRFIFCVVFFFSSGNQLFA